MIMPRYSQTLCRAEKQMRFDALAKLHNDADAIVDAIRKGIAEGDTQLIKLGSELVFGKAKRAETKINIPELANVPLLERPEKIAQLVMRGELSLETARAMSDLTANAVEMGQLKVLQQFTMRIANGESPGVVAAELMPALQRLDGQDMGPKPVPDFLE
jgi:hypothetical protein